MALSPTRQPPSGRTQSSLRHDYRGSPRRRSCSPSVKGEICVEFQVETTHAQSPPTYPYHQSNPDVNPTSVTDDNLRLVDPAVPTEDIHSPHRGRCSLISLYELFISLERTCIDAASRYWRSQSHLKPVQCFVHRTFHNERAGARFHPYASGPYDHGVLEPSFQLLDYMQLISQMLWDRAIRSGDHTEILEAVHRMGNLYSWGDKVRAAAEWKIQEGVGSGLGTGASMAVMPNREAILDVTRASRDLVSWLLSEDGKRKVDQLRVEEWDFGEGITVPGSPVTEGNEGYE